MGNLSSFQGFSLCPDIRTHCAISPHTSCRSIHLLFPPDCQTTAPSLLCFHQSIWVVFFCFVFFQFYIRLLTGITTRLKSIQRWSLPIMWCYMKSQHTAIANSADAKCSCSSIRASRFATHITLLVDSSGTNNSNFSDFRGRNATFTSPEGKAKWFQQNFTHCPMTLWGCMYKMRLEALWRQRHYVKRWFISPEWCPLSLLFFPVLMPATFKGGRFGDVDVV